MALKIKPGCVIYFDSARPAVDSLSDEQAGMLFRALLDYAQYKTDVDPVDPAVRLAFQMMKGQLDRDEEKYRNKQLKTMYTRYTEKQEKAGQSALEYDDWVSCIDVDEHRNTSINTTQPIQTQHNPNMNTKQLHLQRDARGKDDDARARDRERDFEKKRQERIKEAALY